MIKGYHHYLYPAIVQPSDLCEELLDQYETEHPHQRCLPPGRTGPAAAHLYKITCDILKNSNKTSRFLGGIYCARCVWVSVTIWRGAVDERLPAVNAHTPLVVQQGVVGGAAVAHHALNQILQQTQVCLTNIIKVTALKFQKHHIHTHTSLSWKGLERMVRQPSSIDSWKREGMCSSCSFSYAYLASLYAPSCRLCLASAYKVFL